MLKALKFIQTKLEQECAEAASLLELQAEQFNIERKHHEEAVGQKDAIAAAFQKTIEEVCCWSYIIVFNK